MDSPYLAFLASSAHPVCHAFQNTNVATSPLQPTTSYHSSLSLTTSIRSRHRCIHMVSDTVTIERPQKDIRVVKSGIRITAPLELVWSVLTQYDKLSEVVPNLALSSRKYHPRGGIRVEQCGVQNILGFQFQASVTMDMTECLDSDECRRIVFDMVDSRDFKMFEGVWTLSRLTSKVTKLNYEVTISPKGLVPVAAVEWRIKEDVPTNLEALKVACETRVAAAANVNSTNK
mmetsp:Transcript_12877/g.22089  ORF Transcript_12877/g.22089 Transcript_12877/m.22089 type:complete len:231 (-) Transcript_12877:218-910(-)